MVHSWKDKRVLITGADGFIGSHLTEMLCMEGAQVRALSQYNSFNNWGWLEKVAPANNLEVITGDIRDPDDCVRMTADVDVIFHLASLIAIPYSVQNPRPYLDTNIYGTLNMCLAAKKSHSKMIYISSSEVYGSAQYLPIDERHPLQAQSPYSATKIGSEAIVYSFFCTYGLEAVIVRPFNTYGPRQSARAIIPAIITQLATGSKEIKVGSTFPRRDLNYVSDTCRGMLLIAQCDDAAGQTINIGSGRDYTMAQVISFIQELMSTDAAVVTDTARLRPVNGEVVHLLCDNTKIQRLTGFQPEVDLRSGLRRTIKWFREPENAAHYKTGIYNV